MDSKCVDIKDWIKEPGTTKGSRNKQWVIKPIDSSKKLDRFLFKESNSRYPTEFWTEIIASKIGKIVGVTIPETYCAKLNDKYAALIKFFLRIDWNEEKGRYEQVETLDEGGDIIMAIDPSFDRKKGERHNIFIVEKIFILLQKEALFKRFLKILIFDTLIGNTDRHQDNWGFIKEVNTDKLDLAPAFDNSTSLGSELVEEKLSGYISQDGVKLNDYIYKGRAHIRWSTNGDELLRVNHFELLKKIALKNEYIIDYIKEMTRFPDEQIDAVLDEIMKIEVHIPKYKISENRKKLIKKIICYRRDLLKKEFELT